ncbi:MAG: hypothetical protein JO337_06020 [Acidimicrobiales bacterium]|nr:hypothetical protein [Acidimicrobiales bacterium]
MRGGRLWLVVGAALGVAIALGHLPYLAGAGRSLANTAERLVMSGANRIIHSGADHGAPRRVLLGVGAVLAVALPGLTALLLLVAARASLRLRALIALGMVALGASSYAYQTKGAATGVLLLALLIAGIAVAVTGPLVAAPLAMGAGLIGAEFLPTLVTSRLGSAVSQSSVNAMHLAIYNRPGTPAVLQIALLLLAAVPFAFAARLLISG